MKKPTKFTFKIHKPTGRYRSFDTDYVDIKIKKKIVGTIFEKKGWEGYVAKFMIKKDDSFKWIKIKHETTTLPDMKEYLNKMFIKITKELDLFSYEGEVGLYKGDEK